MDDLKATGLDLATCRYSLQMLKAALFYFPPPLRRTLSLWIKAQEFQNTVELFRNSSESEVLAACSMAEPKAPQSFFDLFSEIKDYGSPEQRQAFDRFSSLLQVMTLYEQFRQTSDPIPEEPDVSDSATEESGFDASGHEIAEQSPQFSEPVISVDSSGEPVLTAASLNRRTPESVTPSKSFSALIRDGLAPEKRRLFDAYQAMFRPIIGGASRKEETT